MGTDDLASAVTGGKVSRRWLLRNTANLTAGLVAAGSVQVAASDTAPTVAATPTATAVAPDHDPATGEIFDRERHHHWDTV
jgi:hypothetical protein